MTIGPTLEAFAHNNKITQAEFNSLYVLSLDSPIYRPLVDGKRRFLLAELLLDSGFSADLRDLSLRNLDLRYAEFGGIQLDGADLRGAICNHADLTGVPCLSIKTSGLTKFYKAKLTDAQLLRLQATPKQEAPSQEVSEFPSTFGAELDLSPGV